jgi:hypothetical protein
MLLQYCDDIVTQYLDQNILCYNIYHNIISMIIYHQLILNTLLKCCIKIKIYENNKFMMFEIITNTIEPV